ncbi:RIMS-binding protein 2 isoform X12 [Xenopus tropicalis]|uniref:RIMS-binding protein 2 n=1 Tax=Xenopus tropicalis TaxID=8364 RepID=A0A8J1JKB8_XENTR|nr:RIMS-binding protein 2 isoform X12 [Xenopus tropicalis]
MGWKLSLFHNRMFMLDWYHVTPMLSSLVSHAKIRLGSEPLSQASGSTLAPVQQLKSVSFSAIGRHVPIAHVTFDLRNPGAFIATNQFIGFNKPASLYILIFLTILIMKEEPKEVSSNRKDTVNTEKRNDHDLTLQESLQTDTKVEKSNSTREKEKKRPQKPESSKVGERASKLQGQRAPTKNTEKANAPVSTKTKQKKTSSASSAKRPSTKQTMRSVIGGPGHPPCPSKDSEREVEIRLLQVECDELRNRLGCLKEGLMGQKPSDVEQLLRQSQKELLWLQRQLSFISNGGPACILSPNKFRNDLQCLPPSVQHRSYSHIQFLEEKSRPFKSDVTSVSPEKLHWNFLEDELKDVVQDKSRLSLQYASLSHRALLYDQVKSDYEQLRETLVIVTRERDLAVKEKYQLQAKLENLEQVLKHMREAAERRQQLELEHEQALAVLNAKQQEIDLLQKAQVEAKIEHEGAVQLLENTLDSMQAKVRELEEKCRTQSEQFNLLSRELEKFRQQAGKIDLLSGNAGGVLDFPGSPNKTLTQFINGIATSISKGNESPTGSRSVISEYIRPLQITGDKPEQLCVKPTFLSRSRSGSPRRGFECNMDKEQNTNTSKQRYSGKVHLCIARYSYNPFDGPNENPEAELPLVAGKYLYVYGDMDEDGFYEGELLDGQRGLVPSNFVDFVQNDEFHMSSTLASEQEENILNHSAPLLQSELKLEITPSIHMESSVLNNGTGTTMDVNIDEIGEDIVPYPRKITLIKQLAKSVIVGWEPPLVPPGWGTIHSYNVLIGKEIRATLNFGSRTKLLLEKLDLATVTYRLSIQTVTDRGNSDELQCSLLVGKDVIVAPTHLKVDNITPMSAELIWLPSNSNYSHVIFLNDEEYDIVKAASYRYHFFNLKPNMTYKVKLLAKPHQMPWQLPLEQRERKEAYTEFTTLPSGPPIPPDNVIVHQGPTPVTLLVTWKPPVLSPTGTSNGAHVTGFSVYARGQKVAEVVFPAAENIVVDLLKLLNLDAKEVTVRTLSAQGESEDSISALIPPDLMVPPIQHPRTMPKCKPLATAGVPDTKDDHVCPHRKVDESWEHTRTASPVHGHTLEPPTSNFHSPVHGRRSPSPQRILPQPQGAPVSNTMAKAMAREAAQRVAESTRNEKRSLFSERSNSVHYANSDEEEDGYDSPHIKRKGASVDEFLKGSELGKQSHYCPGEDYHTESSRGSDLSDILEEDEEELYSEMQLEDGGRRRVSITSHNTLKLLGNHPTLSRTDHQTRRFSHGSAAPQRPRPMMVPSIEITMDSNSEGGRSRSGSEGNISPVKEEAYYRSLGGHRKWSLQPTRVSDDRYDSYGSREQLSMYEESETDGGMEDFPARIFVALFDYDPRTMSPNPDAAEEELPFKEGQVIKVYGDKDSDGFYRGETCERAGFIPCNMVSEIQVDDEEMMEQLFKQGFLPLNTPVEKIVNCERFKESSRSVHRRSRKSKRERNRRSGRQHSVTTRRMVALYDYDPRESSPNVDVEAELTFCTGDILNVFGEIDEDGFYYGELNGHKGLVPSNFLEEVPDDVEVYLSDTPSRYPQDTPMRTKVKRVPSENTGTPRRAPSPTVHLHSMSPPSSMGSGSPMRGRDRSSKKKKGLLSKGRKFLKKLGAVK